MAEMIPFGAERNEAVPWPLLVEFETIARAILGDDPAAVGFAVKGWHPGSTNGAWLPADDGVPSGKRNSADNYWMPDREVAVELAARTVALRSRRWDADTRLVTAIPPDWRGIIQQTWPHQFDCDVICSGGWADLIMAVQGWLDERGEAVAWRVVKEKFGTLRLRGKGLSEWGRDLESTAQIISTHICEECGRPGKIRNRDWVRTLCDDHAATDHNRRP